MKLDWRFWSVVVVVALIASTLSRIIWPDLPEMAPPTAAQLPFFIGVSIAEAVALGFAAALLVFGFSHVGQILPGRLWLSRLSFVAVLWLLGSWWVHDNLHRTTEHADYWRLLAIEYGFHITLMLAGGVLAYLLYQLYQERSLYSGT